MTKKHFLNEILSPKLLVVAWGFILVICVFIGFTIRGKCASQTSTEIPYNVAEMQSYNEMMLSRLDLALSQYRTGHNIDESVPLLVWTQDGYYNGNFWQYFIMREPTLTTGYNYQQGYDFLTNYIRFTSQYQIESISIMNNGSVGAWSINLGLNAALCGNAQSVQTTEGYYLPRYPFYYNGEPLIDSVYNTEVLISRVNGLAPTGQTTQPDLTGDNIGNDKPDIDDYLPTLPNMPTIDNSSLEKIAESIFNILQWGFNAIKGTLYGFFEYLGDLLSYSFQKVIDNIKNGIQNLYDNFKSLFEPLLNGIAALLNSISQKLDYISQPFDSEALQEAFENTAINGDIDSISQLNEQAFGTWSTTEEPNEFKIALHTEQIPLADNVNFTATTQYIDLGVINGAKPYIRGVMWCLLTFSLLYTIIDSIPNYIGGNDE